MKAKHKILLAVLLACGSLLTLGLVFGKGGDDADGLSWDVVSRGDVRETVQASGEIQARTRVNIGTNVAGEIKAIFVKDGQEVAAGQPLVSIDRVRVQEQLRQVEAVLQSARKDAERLDAARMRARESATRTESLFKQGLVSDEIYRQAKLDRDSAELSYQSAQANVVQNEASVKAAQDGLSKTQIVAPISGRVTALKAEVGEMAIPGVSNLPGATLMVISDMKELLAEVKVNESEVVRLKVGQSVQVTVDSLPGRVFLGRVDEIASGADTSTQAANMYTVKVALDMTNRSAALLRPGMSARGVILTADVKNAVRVPLQAVLERDGTLDDAVKKGLLVPESRSVVMVVKNGKAAERTVQTGIANTQFYEITGGIAAGETVLTGPSRKLRDLKDRAAVTLRRKSDAQIEKDERRS